MFETYTTVTGRVITDPRHHQTAAGGEVLSFRVACHSRKLDRETGQWADGPTLFLTVSCWRRLAAAAAGVIVKGSPIIARGSLRTNEYQSADGARRSDLEMTATSLGLDLNHPAGERSTADATGGNGGPGEAAPVWGQPPNDEAGAGAAEPVVPLGAEPPPDDAVA